MTDTELSSDSGASDSGADSGGGFDSQAAAQSLYAQTYTNKPESEAKPAAGDNGAGNRSAAASSDGAFEIDTSSIEGADAETTSAFASVAAEVGLDGPKAQAVYNKMSAVMAERAEAQQAAFKQDLANQSGEEFGADLKTVVRDARHGLQRVESGKALGELLDSSGLGSHPVILKFLSEIGNDY
jgi:hypothetical protein